MRGIVTTVQTTSRDSTSLQPVLWEEQSCSSRTPALAFSIRQAARNRWTEDVEVVWQHHHAYRPRAGDTAKAEDYGYGSRACPPLGSRQSRCLSGRGPSQDLQRPRHHRKSQRRLPLREHWLHRVQELGRRCPS